MSNRASKQSLAKAKEGFKPKETKPAQKEAKAEQKAPPPPSQRPIEIDDDDEEDSEPEQEEADEPMEDDDDMSFPVLKETPKKKAAKKAAASAGPRSTITYRRIKTSAPFQVNAMLFFKNFDSLTFLVSPADAKAVNEDLSKNFGMDPDKPLIKYSDDWQAWMLRGKPVGTLKGIYDEIAQKRSYTVHFNIGEWANSADMTSGISAQVVQLFDPRGNPLAKAPDIAFPAHSTYSAGRLITAEEEAEAKRNMP